MNMEEVETKEANSELGGKDDWGNSKCSELEERSKSAEAKIVKLEQEIEKMKSEYEALQAKFEVLQAEKSEVEDELKILKGKNNEVKEDNSCVKKKGNASFRAEKEMCSVIDLAEDEDKAVQLMIENKILECEKKLAESEAKNWKEKFKQLELLISVFDDGTVRPLNDVIKGRKPDARDQLQAKEKPGNLVDIGAALSTAGKDTGILPSVDTSYIDIPPQHATAFTGRKVGVRFESEKECRRQIRKRLSFVEQRSPCTRMAPLTPAGDKTACIRVIDICDSDDEPDNHGIQKTSQDDVEDIDACKDNVPHISTPKRKRATNMVTSDSESDEDDNIPINELKKLHFREPIHDKASSDVQGCSTTATPMTDDIKGTVTRRRLATLRQFEEKSKAERSSSSKVRETKYQRGIPTADDVEDSESEEVGSDEGESLDGFIVHSSDTSDGDIGSGKLEDKSDENLDDGVSDASGGDDGCGETEDELDANAELQEILSTLGRSRRHKHEWEFEADMLAAFGKDAELCMKAVCALYRQQEPDEQVGKETYYNNGRGFSKFDAFRGSTLGQFLTDGDPTGGLKKSVQQLQEYESKGIELCRTLATRYSKQLFEIYKNKEDPHFLPC